MTLPGARLALRGDPALARAWCDERRLPGLLRRGIDGTWLLDLVENGPAGWSGHWGEPEHLARDLGARVGYPVAVLGLHGDDDLVADAERALRPEALDPDDAAVDDLPQWVRRLLGLLGPGGWPAVRSVALVPDEPPLRRALAAAVGSRLVVLPDRAGRAVMAFAGSGRSDEDALALAMGAAARRRQAAVSVAVWSEEQGEVRVVAAGSPVATLPWGDRAELVGATGRPPADLEALTLLLPDADHLAGALSPLGVEAAAVRRLAGRAAHASSAQAVYEVLALLPLDRTEPVQQALLDGAPLEEVPEAVVVEPGGPVRAVLAAARGGAGAAPMVTVPLMLVVLPFLLVGIAVKAAAVVEGAADTGDVVFGSLWSAVLLLWYVPTLVAAARRRRR